MKYEFGVPLSCSHAFLQKVSADPCQMHVQAQHDMPLYFNSSQLESEPGRNGTSSLLQRD